MEFRREDRDRAIAWARSVVSDSRVIYLDTETTGLDRTAEIIDIALVTNEGAVLFDTLVKPVRPIPAESSRIHGIFDDHVATAPGWEEVAPWLDTMLHGRRVVVYNAEYDAGIVNAMCDRAGGRRIASDWECAMLHYSAYAGEPGRYGGYKWHRLENVAAAFGIVPGGHRALEDAVACRNVVAAMATAT